MAKTYQGPATITFPGGGITVAADLRVEYGTSETVNGAGWVERTNGLKSWLGSVQADPDEGFGEVFSAQAAGGSLRLRLPDGRRGEFFPTGANSDGRMEIEGCGRAPFWDDSDDN